MLFLLIVLSHFCTMVAGSPIAYVQFSAPVSVSRSLPQESIADIREAVLDGLKDSNRFKNVILLSDSLSQDLSSNDILAIRDSLDAQKDVVLVVALISDLEIKKHQGQRIDDESDLYLIQTSDDNNVVSLSINIKFIDLEDGELIYSKTSTWPKSSMSHICASLSKEMLTTPIKDLTSGISKDIKKLSNDSFPLSASVFDFNLDKKGEIKSVQILIDPEDKISIGDKVDVMAKRKIGNRIVKNHIAEGRIIRSVNDSVVVCKIKKGSYNMKESLSKDKKIVVQIK